MASDLPYPRAGGWGQFVGPLADRLDLIAATGLTATHTPESTKVLADLLRTMAARIDNPPIETMTVDQLLAGEFPAGFLNAGDAQ
jgi:hypothetical protein